MSQNLSNISNFWYNKKLSREAENDNFYGRYASLERLDLLTSWIRSLCYAQKPAGPKDFFFWNLVAKETIWLKKKYEL